MHYGADLARVHHDHFGAVARAAAVELTTRLAKKGIVSGTVVDLAAGSGILSRLVTDAGFRALGVDISPDMLRLAQVEAPTAVFVEGSLWSAELPTCVAVAAIGEAFCYAGDPAAGPAALAQRLSAIHAALVPHGILLFDVSGPGRGGPSGVRHVVSSRGGIKVMLEEREDEGGLGRTITLLVPEGDHYRRVEERHRLRVYPPGQIEAFLSGAGFAWERLDGYDQLPLLPGWHAWAATPRPGTGGGH